VVIAGPVFGPTIGGYITTHSDWRWIFFVNLPVGIAAVLLCLQALPKDEPSGESTSKVDWLGIGLLVLGLGSLQTMLEEGNSDGWFDSTFITMLVCLAVTGLATFVWRELSTEHPIVDLRVLRYRSLSAGSMLSIVVGIALYGAMFAVPIFAQSILHFTSQQTGLLMMPGAIMSAVSMQLAGRLSRRYDPRRVLCAGGLILAGSLLWVGTLSVNTGESDLIWPLLVRALGTSLMFVPLNLSAISPIPRHDVAKATGIFNLTRQLGGSIGVALLSTILDRRMLFHRNIISSHLSVDDPHVMERVNQLTQLYVSHGSSEPVAHQQALQTLTGMVQQQASVLSFNDTFYIVAGLVLLFLPLIFLLGKPPANAKMVDVH
jgi:DHA2 family multidrug resistance protein